MKILNAKLVGTKRLGAVYIGRPSVWGNPFVLGRDGNRDEVIELYRRWILERPELMQKAKQELKGKDLICWCSPCSCHGEVLRDIVEEKE